jgi:membrane protease YdiL (CAAX protease family)
MKRHPLLAYLVLVALLSGGFIVGMMTLGKQGQYLAGPYMFVPALAALVTRLFFYERRFADARLRPGRWRDHGRFWVVTLGVVALSYVVYTLLGAISWDLGGGTFLTQLKDQMAMSGQDIEDLPAGLTPRTMLVIFFLGGLTIFNIPMIVVGFGEEFGWRGFMFPQLCRSRLWAGLVAGGLIWFAWHVPLTLVMPSQVDMTVWQHVVNGVVLAVGSVLTFVYFAYVYARTGSIWVVSLVHAVFNNGSRSFAYFVTVEDQLLANLGLALTMLAVVAVLHVRKELAVFGGFLAGDGEAA